MITYAHEKYIRQAIEGVLMQDINFEVELIIADDNSPDNTEQVVLDIASSHPNGKWIKYTKHNKNKGMMPNFIWTLEQCKGKYIAMCEGDDYWTDPNKLQKQVDFLEGNEEYVLCFHNVLIQDDKEIMKKDAISDHLGNTMSMIDLAKGNFIHTPSVVFRNNFELPNWYYSLPLGDWPLYLIIIKNKKIKKLDDVMCVYREHPNGIWSQTTKNQKYLVIIKTIRILLENLNADLIVKDLLSKSLEKYEKRIAYNKKGFFNTFKKIIKRLISKFNLD